MTAPVRPVEILAALSLDPHRPRLVWQGPQGRTELSGATLTNWIAKVSGLLRDELALGPGDIAAMCPARSWQAVAAVCGSLWSGLTICPSPDADAAVAFVDAGDDASADEVFALSTHPFGVPTGEIPAHQRHFTESVLVQSDHPAPPTAAGIAWTDGVATTTSDALEHMIRSAAADAADVDGDADCDHVDGDDVDGDEVDSDVDSDVDGDAADSNDVDGDADCDHVDGDEVVCRAWDGSAQTLAAWLGAWASGRAVSVTGPRDLAEQ